VIGSDAREMRVLRVRVVPHYEHSLVAVVVATAAVVVVEIPNYPTVVETLVRTAVVVVVSVRLVAGDATWNGR